MIITINANDDTLVIETENGDTLNFTKLRSPYEIKNILEEVLNQLDDSRLSSATPTFGIELKYIDEDKERTIGEW